MLFRLVGHSSLGSKIVSNFDSESDFDYDAYFVIAPLEKPISLRSSLCMSLRVCMVVSLPEG